MNLVRCPYTPDRLEGLVAFSDANPPSRVHAAPTRRLFEELAPPEGVLDIAADGRRAFAGAVVDRCENLHDAALLEVLGWDRAVPLPALLDVATPPALAVARRARRATVSLSLPVGLGGDLPAAGWTRAEGSYVMERDLSAWSPPPSPPNAAWEDLSPLGVAEHYDVVRAAFADDPGMMLPDLPTFALASLGAAVPVRVLRAAGREIAFARGTLEEGGRLGYVASIGRAPEWQGRGLGPVVLAEALRQLAARRVVRFRLGVTATNPAALALYRRWGFVEVEAWQTWRRALASEET
ncbi:MAG: N-acetyltransferase [Pseudomonadota bacterium]|nr:N-acetyltransferase [Pseudomonadota bacterium]